MRGGGGGRKHGGGAVRPTTYRDDDDRDEGRPFFDNHAGGQQAQMQQQDAQLDDLHGSVQRLGDLSLTISNELDLQNQMLDDLDDDLTVAQTAMDAVNKKTQELVKAAGGPQYFCVIVFLSVVLFILFMLVVG